MRESAAAGSGKRGFALAAALCGVFGVAAWAFYVRSFAAHFGQDFYVFYNAARLYFEGRLALLFDAAGFTQALNLRFAIPGAGLHPWLYPPHFLLALLPFGLVGFRAALVLFLFATFAAAVAALSLVAERPWQRALHVASLALSPAAALALCLGQNAFLTLALIIGGFGLVRRRPVLGGALLGLVTYKPQLFLMVPVALAASREWRSLAAAGTAAVLAMAASALVFGLEPWRQWLMLMSGANELYARWVAVGELKGQSVYACVIMLGMAPALAGVIQSCVAAGAAVAVWRIHHMDAAADLKLAVLLAAAMLTTPHVMAYDAVLTAAAASILVRHGLEDGFRPGEMAVAMLLWGSSAFPPSVFRIGLVIPVLVILFIAAVMARVRAAPLRLAAAAT